jgi:8-oxo-dGTP diphosphatase
MNEIPELAFDHNKIIEKARSDINGILSEMQKHDDARKERF